jgi:Na+-transporting NADH:ubiquinone oxidoreductase subunit C
MKKYLRMLTFVAILGGVSSGLLVGAQLLTSDRITANADALLKSEILNAHEVAYNFTNIHDVFAENTTIYDYITTYQNDVLTLRFWEDNTSGRITFQFGPTFGGGVWGPIIGLLSLESDFSTIVRIAILQQEETPGLGGVVATRPYLDQFVGKTIDEGLDIIKGLDPLDAAINEVPAITGATGTSTRFDIILNSSYEAHLAAWTSKITVPEGGNN